MGCITQTQHAATGSHKLQVAHIVHAHAQLGVEAQHDVPVVEVADDFTGLVTIHGSRHLLGGIGHGEAVGRQNLAVVVHTDGVDHHFAVGAGIGHLGQRAENLGCLLGSVANLRQLRAVDVDGNLRIGTRKSRRNTVCQRVANHTAHAGHAGNHLADILANLALVVVQIHTNHKLRSTHGLGVLVILGATGALGHSFHALNLLQLSHHLAGNTLRLRQ